MKFLTDQDVYGSTVRLLLGLGHDVAPVAQIGLARAEDVYLLRVAGEQSRLLVTRDRDFGGLVFVKDERQGVIYLRMSPATQGVVHAEFERVLTLYNEVELRQAFLVIEPGRHRIRRRT